jgi:pantoate--beta-alanine ligase
LIEKGEKKSAFIIQKIREIIKKEPSAKIDYIEIVDLDELAPLKEIEKEALIALAVFIGKTRLIDNTIVETKR